MSDATADLLTDQDLPPAELLDAALDDLHVHRWECELAEMLEIVIAAHTRSGLDRAQARRLAVAALLALGQYMGGRMAYLPRGDGLRRAVRNRLIYRQFTGNNHRALAREHRLSLKTIYAIVNRQRAIDRRQAELL